MCSAFLPLPQFRRFFVTALLFTTSVFSAPEKWSAQINAFTTADAAQPPTPGAVVFVGHSSILKWTTLATDFPFTKVLNRGFGGSELSDTVFYANRIVIPYAPRKVVVYAGENDLQAGKSTHTLVADFQAFCAKIHAALPKSQIIFLAMKESPSRAKIRDKLLLGNLLIAAECA